MSRRNSVMGHLDAVNSHPTSVTDNPLPMLAKPPCRKPRRRPILRRVGLLLCIQCLVLVLVILLLNYVLILESRRTPRGMGEPGTRLKGFNFGFGGGGVDKGSGQDIGKDAFKEFRQDVPTNFNPRAVLLVALADGKEGMIALQAWARFVSREVRLRRRSDNRGVKPEKGGFHSRDASSEETEDRKTIIPPQLSGPFRTRNDIPSDDFPAVWMLTKDPYLDEVIRSEMMPYLRPFFVVAGTAASAYVSSSDDSLAGPSAPAHIVAAISAAAASAASEAADAAASEAVYSSLWVDVIERFLAENQGVDVFGVFGEGTLPSPGLERVVDVLRPVMGRSAPPTAVLARSRFLGAGGDADGWRREDGGKVKGEWLPDKLLAQVWFNRAMLAAARRKGTSLQDEVVGVGGRGCGEQQGLSMLQVLRRLVHDPSALGALIVDGTTVVGATHVRARGWSPPVEAMAAVREAKAGGRGQGKGWSLQVEGYQSDSADLGVDEDGDDDIVSAALGETSSASEWWIYDDEEDDSERMRGWESFWGDSPLSGFSLDGSQEHKKEGHESSCEEANEGDLHIGNVEYALVKERGGASQRGGIGSGSESGGGYVIQKAMWPRRYILDAVADPESGLVMVTNVNCGYLDMAVNFLLSVQRHSDVKILFVAMDEVSFEYLDSLTPGCVVLYDNGISRPRAVGAGEWGDATFKAETVVRPAILLNIMRQGYTILWTDVDMVWLGNPLGWLPNKRKNPSAAEIMLQIDGMPINKCTCFMYLDPTPPVLRLIELWKQEIIDTRVDQNQEAFHSPLIKMEGEGLQLDILPDEVMPPGFKVFNRTFMKANRHRYEGRLLIIHNNWIIGHDPKRQRFKDYNLWDVEDWEFPKCDRRRSLRITEQDDWTYY